MCQHAFPPATSPAVASATFERSFPGHDRQLRHVRALITRFLLGCPAADDVTLLVSELCANAVAHSASGRPGGTFTLRVRRHGTTCIYAEVEDEGSRWNGNLTTARSPHGLYLLRQLSTRYGTRPGPHGWITWLTITSPPAATRPPQP